MCSNDEIIKQFLNKCNIVFDDFSIEGMQIPRDFFIRRYNQVKKDIDEIKKFIVVEMYDCITKMQKKSKVDIT